MPISMHEYSNRLPPDGKQRDEHVHAGFRVTGQEREALKHRLSEAGFAWKCKYNGVSPDRAPWQYRYASNALMLTWIEARA